MSIIVYFNSSWCSNLVPCIFDHFYRGKNSLFKLDLMLRLKTLLHILMLSQHFLDDT